MFKQNETVTDKQLIEATRKAEVIERLIDSEGWKLVVELIDKLIAKEAEGLAGQNIDANYYKKIGFLQSIVYFKELPGIVKDKKVREFILHQGRLIGFRWAQKSPKHFFEAGAAAQRFLEQNAKNQDKGLQLKEKNEFFENQKNV